MLMKKFLFVFASVFMSTVAAVSFISNNQVNDYLNANVEALANSESSICSFDSVKKVQSTHTLKCSGKGSQCCKFDE